MYLINNLENQITYRSLKYLNESDIKDAIKNIGLRAEFREKLFSWRKVKFPNNENDDSSKQELVAPSALSTPTPSTSRIVFDCSNVSQNMFSLI